MAFWSLSKRLALFVWRRGCTRYEIRGVSIFLWYDDPDEQELARANVEKALQYIAVFDPHRFGRIQRDLPILIGYPIPGGTLAQYHRDVGICLLDSRHLLSDHPGITAQSIVHEATHARMRGLHNSSPERRARMEQICLDAEIAFTQRVPGTDRSVETLRDMRDSLVTGR